jgi:hypothetical protein
VLPVAWTEVIDRIQSVVNQALNDAVERERKLAEASPPVEQPPPFPDGLEQFELRMRDFSTRLQLAEQKAAQTDALVMAGQQAIENWLEAAAAVRQRLAKWHVPSL